MKMQKNEVAPQKKKRGRPKKQKNPPTASTTGSAYPSLSLGFDAAKRVDIKTLDMIKRVGPVQRSIRQLRLISFPYFTFKIVPPKDVPEDSDELRDLINMMEEFDRKYVKTTALCNQAFEDVITYGSAIFEVVWDSIDGWNIPTLVQRLPAKSFSAQASETTDVNRFMVGNLLKGIAYDRQSRTMLYNQSQGQGMYVAIPSDRIIHIRDECSEYVDGESYLAGIVHTIQQLDFVRKRFMQFMNRFGTPQMIATVGVPDSMQDDMGTQTTLMPGGTSSPSDGVFTQLWEYMSKVVENQSADQAILIPDGAEVKWQSVNAAIDPTVPDAYLIREAILHLFPRDFVDVIAQSISTTSTPLVLLLKMIIQGWQQIVSIPFEEKIWTEFLALNGYEGYRVELEWASVVPVDEEKRDRLAMQEFLAHVITLDQARAKMGLPPLSDEERVQIYEELDVWRSGRDGRDQANEAFGGTTAVAEGNEEVGDAIEEELKTPGFGPSHKDKDFPKYSCKQCGYSWEAKSYAKPASCPNCGSKSWDGARKKKK